MAADPDDTTVLVTPADVLAGIVDAAEHVAHQTEAAMVPVVTRAYRQGWADGYLARVREVGGEG